MTSPAVVPSMITLPPTPSSPSRVADSAMTGRALYGRNRVGPSARDSEATIVGRRASGGADGVRVLQKLPQAALSASGVIDECIVGGVDDQVVGKPYVHVRDICATDSDRGIGVAGAEVVSRSGVIDRGVLTTV